MHILVRETIFVHACQLDGIIIMIKYQPDTWAIKRDHVIRHNCVDGFVGSIYSILLLQGPRTWNHIFVGSVDVWVVDLCAT